MTDQALQPVSDEPMQLAEPGDMPDWIIAKRERWRYLLALASAVYSSGLAPSNHKTKEQTAVVMLAGRSYGFDEMQSLRLLDVVQGQAVLEGQGMAAIVYREKAGSFDIEEGDGFCTVTGTRTDNGKSFPATWTMEDAANAGLLTKDNWRKHPKQMLRWRAMADVCRVLFPDLLAGAYLRDEADEFRQEPPEPAQSRTVAIIDALRGAHKSGTPDAPALPSGPVEEDDPDPGVQAHSTPDSAEEDREDGAKRHQTYPTEPRQGRAPGLVWINAARRLRVPDELLEDAARGLRRLDTSSRTQFLRAVRELGEDVVREAFPTPASAEAVLNPEEPEDAEDEPEPEAEPEDEPVGKKLQRARNIVSDAERRKTQLHRLDQLMTSNPKDFDAALEASGIELGEQGLDALDVKQAEALLKDVSKRVLQGIET